MRKQAQRSFFSKAGLCSGEQGDKTRGLSTQRGDEIRDSSPKQATRSFFRKQAKRCERELAGFFRKQGTPLADRRCFFRKAESTSQKL